MTGPIEIRVMVGGDRVGRWLAKNGHRYDLRSGGLPFGAFTVVLMDAPIAVGWGAVRRNGHT